MSAITQHQPLEVEIKGLKTGHSLRVKNSSSRPNSREPSFQLLQRFQKPPNGPTLYPVDMLWNDGDDLAGRNADELCKISCGEDVAS